jgi:hypothetical protein
MNRIARALSLLVLVALAAPAQSALVTPKEHFGHNIGDDYFLPNYKQFESYLQKLAAKSDRMKLVDMGRTEEGRTQWMTVMSAPENLKLMEKYRDISRRLGKAEGLSSEQARALAAEGKAVVWIDGGLHSTEIVGTNQLIELIWQLASRNDSETARILKDVIVLCVHANPDGMDLVADGYMSNPEPTKRRYTAVKLYQKYTGHDNNRDFYMATQAETRNIMRQLYIEWIPQILYNHHQTGPPGTVLFCPPFRDPSSYFYDPLLMIGIDQVGSAMHARFAVEDKPGFTTRDGASFSVWYNGGLRTTANYHNIIGILTEITGNPTPMNIPFVPERLLKNKTMPYPIAPQEKWHFRQSIDYSMSANYAILDYASKHREDLLFNIYKMGSNHISKGSNDNWTMYSSRIEALQKQVAADRSAPNANSTNYFTAGVTPMKYYKDLLKPEWRDPRGYIIPANQADFNTATKFVHSMMWAGVDVHRATADFTVAGRNYPAGSYIMKTAQAFRAHVLDQFEPQEYPNEFRYPGGPPIAPYDSAGWTLAYQMGVSFDRVLDDFNGPFEKLKDMPSIPRGAIAGSVDSAKAAGWLLGPEKNDAFIAANRVFAAGGEIQRFRKALSVEGRNYAPGAMFIPNKPGLAAVLKKAAEEKGLTFVSLARKPDGDTVPMKPVRIGVWDNVGGSMPSGWTRWLFERFEFPYNVVYAPDLDKGDLRSRYDVIIFVSGGISSPRRYMDFRTPEPDLSQYPEEWRSRVGRVTMDKTMPQLKAFMESGGSVLTIGSSTALAEWLGLPMANALVEFGPDGKERALPREKFYIPGSLLQVNIDNTNPIAWGMPEKADVFYEESPAFRLKPEAAMKGLKPVAWYGSEKPLRSGWAWGQHYLNGAVAIAEASVGEGKLVLFGPEVIFRAQPHGTFKLFFNSLFASQSR